MNKNVIFNAIILIMAIFMQMTAIAQDLVKLDGRVIDEEKASVPFATVGLFKDSTLVTGTTTMDDGHFNIDNIKEGNYRLVIRSVGFKEQSINIQLNTKQKHLKDLVLYADRQILGDVTVKGILPSVVRKVDRFVINVENATITNGKNALEALRYAPGVMFSHDGAISLNGKSGLLIYVDGKPLNLDEAGRMEFIRSLRAQDIQRYEIIPDATAKYGAEGQGGVIEIFLKKSAKRGISGGVHLSVSKAKDWGASSGANFTYNVKNTSVYGNYSYSYSPSYFKSDGHKVFLQTGLKQHNVSSDDGTGRPQNFRVGVRQKIGDRHELGLEMYGTNSKYKNTEMNSTVGFMNGSRESVTNMLGEYDSKNHNTNYSLNYLFDIDGKGQKLKLLADYSTVDNKQDQFFMNSHSEAGNLSSKSEKQQNEKNDFNIYSTELSYSLPVNEKLSFDLGARYSNTSLKNRSDFFDNNGNGWIPNQEFSTVYDYKESMFASYAMVQYHAGKWGGNIGLRGENIKRDFDLYSENTFMNSDDLEWFPSCFIQYSPNDKMKWSMAYTRRINRPSYHSLMPFHRYIDNYTIGKGNPTLEPSFVNSVSLNVGYKSVQISLATDFIDNKIYPIYKPVDPSMGKSHYQYENIEYGKQYRANVYFPLRLTKWWELSNNFSLTRREYEDSKWHLDEKKWIYQLNVSSSIVLPAKIYWDIDMMAMSKSMMGVAEYQDGGILVSSGLSRDFFDGNLTTSFSVDDIFGLLSDLEVGSSYNGIETCVLNDFNEQGFSFSISYRFHKGRKRRAKKNEIGNWNEKSRTGVGMK